MLNIEITEQAKLPVELKLDFAALGKIFIENQEIIKENINAEVALVFCDNNFIRGLNKQYRNQDKETNVLSFPYHEQETLESLKEDFYLGDIIVSLEKISEEAKLQNKTQAAHFTHLLYHSLLHLLGYNHDNDVNAAEMEKLEVLFLNKLGYKNPYE